MCGGVARIPVDPDRGATAADALGLIPEGVTVNPNEFIVFSTLQPSSTGTVVGSAQAAAQAARLIYNDFGLVSAGFVPVADVNSLEAFQFFRMPFGNLGRNSFRGLPTYTVNASLFKNVQITEGTRLQLRAEAFNLLNRRNFGVPDLITEDASTGFTVGSYLSPGFNTGGAHLPLRRALLVLTE